MPARLNIKQNEIYGQWLVVEPNVINPQTSSKTYIGRNVYSKCKCLQCNITERYILNHELKKYANKNTPCASCSRRNRAEEKRQIKQGDVFTKLKVIGDAGYKNNRHWSLCQCDCGRVVKIKDNALLSGNTKSCGCLVSVGENKILHILEENNYIFIHDSILPEFLRETGHKYRFDFVIYNKKGQITNIIEFDGRQHFYGPDTSYWSRSLDTLEDIQKRDKIKNDFCLKHNYPLYRIPYTEINNLNIKTLFDNKYLVKKEEK